MSSPCTVRASACRSVHARGLVAAAFVFVAACLAGPAAAEDTTGDFSLPDAQAARLVHVEPGSSVALSARATNRMKERLVSDHHRAFPLMESKAVPLPLREPAPESATSVAEVGSARTRVDVEWHRRLEDGEIGGGPSSPVTEATQAGPGECQLVTGNWFACTTTDFGRTFRYVDPYTSFPSSGSKSFCCDQLSLFVERPGGGLFVWLLQYTNDASENFVRIAVADLAAFKAGSWRYWDVFPSRVGGWTNAWFDYPAMAATRQHLFVTTNVFSTKGQMPWLRSVTLRLPIEALVAGGAVKGRFDASDELPACRPVAGASDTMYLGTHASTDTIRLSRWPDTEASPTRDVATVSRWSDDRRSVGGPPDRNWLRRCDGRITAAWLSSGRACFAWTAAADEAYPLPHVRVACLDVATAVRPIPVVAEPHVWSPSLSFAYLSADVDLDQRVGVSLFYAAQASPPSHAVGVLAGVDPVPSWDLVRTATSEGYPGTKWGDYGSVQALRGGMATPSVAPDGGAAKGSTWSAPAWVHEEPAGLEPGVRVRVVAWSSRRGAAPFALDRTLLERRLEALEAEAGRIRRLLQGADGR